MSANMMYQKFRVFLICLLLLTPAFAQRPALTSPVIRFSDANGKPLVGGYLYSYTAGTTTPLPTYVDSTTGALNTNPVVLDSTGSATVFLGANVYKFVLQNAAHAVQWTADNIAEGMFQTSFVNSVFGRTGTVTARTGDYSCTQITGAICSLPTPPTLFNQTIEVAGIAATQRPVLNFIPGVTGSIYTFTATGGSGYTTSPTVTFTGGGCSVEPTGGVSVASGGLTNPVITSPGSGCTTPPAPNFSGGGGTGGTGSTTLTPAGISCSDNPSHLSTDCTFTFGQGGGGSPSACVLTDQTGSRSVGGIYQNTTDNLMFISGSLGTGGSSTGSLALREGAVSPTTVVYANTSTATVTTGEAGFYGAILPGYFYQLSSDGTVSGVHHWAEVTGCGGGGGGSVSPLTAKGDVFGHSTIDARIPVGTDGQVLTADSTVALGLKWAPPAAASFASPPALGNTTPNTIAATAMTSKSLLVNSTATDCTVGGGVFGGAVCSNQSIADPGTGGVGQSLTGHNVNISAWGPGGGSTENHYVIAHGDVAQLDYSGNHTIHGQFTSASGVGDYIVDSSYDYGHTGAAFGSDQGYNNLYRFGGQGFGNFKGTIGGGTNTFPTFSATSGCAGPHIGCNPSSGSTMLDLTASTVTGFLTGASVPFTGASIAYLDQLPTTGSLPLTTAWAHKSGVSIVPNTTPSAPVSVVVSGLVGGALGGSPLLTTGHVCVVGNGGFEQSTITAVSGAFGAQTVTLPLSYPYTDITLFQGGVCGRAMSFNATQNLSGYRTAYPVFGSLDGTNLIYSVPGYGGMGLVTLPVAGGENETTAGSGDPNAGFTLFGAAQVTQNTSVSSTLPQLEPNLYFTVGHLVDDPDFPVQNTMGLWMAMNQNTASNSVGVLQGGRLSISGMGAGGSAAVLTLANEQTTCSGWYNFGTCGGHITPPNMVPVEGYLRANFPMQFAPRDSFMSVSGHAPGQTTYDLFTDPWGSMALNNAGLWSFSNSSISIPQGHISTAGTGNFMQQIMTLGTGDGGGNSGLALTVGNGAISPTYIGVCDQNPFTGTSPLCVGDGVRTGLVTTANRDLKVNNLTINGTCTGAGCGTGGGGGTLTDNVLVNSPSTGLLFVEADSIGLASTGNFPTDLATLLSVPSGNRRITALGSASLADMLSCATAGAGSCTQDGTWPLTFPLGVTSNAKTLLEPAYNDLSNMVGVPTNPQLSYYAGGLKAWALEFGIPDSQKIAANNTSYCTTTGTWTAATSVPGAGTFPAGTLKSIVPGSTIVCTKQNATDAGIIGLKTTGSTTATFTVTVANAGTTYNVADPYTGSSTLNQTAAYASFWGGISNFYAIGQSGLSGGYTTITVTTASNTTDPVYVVAPYFISPSSSLQNFPSVEVMLESRAGCNGACSTVDGTHHNDSNTNIMRTAQTNVVNELRSNGLNISYFDPNATPSGYNSSDTAQTTDGTHPNSTGGQLIANTAFVNLNSAATTQDHFLPVVASGGAGCTVNCTLTGTGTTAALTLNSATAAGLVLNTSSPTGSQILMTGSGANVDNWTMLNAGSSLVTGGKSFLIGDLTSGFFTWKQVYNGSNKYIEMPSDLANCWSSLADVTVTACDTFFGRYAANSLAIGSSAGASNGTLAVGTLAGSSGAQNIAAATTINSGATATALALSSTATSGTTLTMGGTAANVDTWIFTEDNFHSWLVGDATSGAFGFKMNIGPVVGGGQGFMTVNAPMVYGWNAITVTTDNTGPDTGLSRDSAGVIDVGNGTAGNKSGSMNMTNLTITGTCTGCGSGSSGISGQTLGFVPLAGSASTLTTTSPLDYNITNAGKVTSSVPIVAPSATLGTATAGALAALPSGAHGFACDESATSGVPASGTDYIRCDSTTHNMVASFNNGAERTLLRSSTADFPEHIIIPAANCANGVAGGGWSITSTSGNPQCRAGTNNLGGYVPMISPNSYAQFYFQIPQDWDTASNPYIRFQLSYPGTNGASALTIIPYVQISCMKGDGSTTDDVTFNALHALSTTTTSSNTPNLMFNTSNVQLNSTDMTGCVAGASAVVKVGISGTVDTTINFYSATITVPRTLTVQSN